MAKPNYGYEKRQRELAKKSKKEEKLRRKQGLQGQPQPGEEGGAAPADEAAGSPQVEDAGGAPPADPPRP